MAAVADKPRRNGIDIRLYILSAGILLAFSVLGARLWSLQVVQGDYYRSRAEAQRLYPQRLKAPRGLIVSSDGVVLADTRPAYDLMLVPAECPKEEREAVCQLLQDLLAVDAAQLLERMEDSERQPFTQLPVKQDVPKSVLALVEENSPRLPGVLTVVRPQRRYSGKVGSQMLGYLGEVDEVQLKKEKEAQERTGRPPRYRMGDVIGRAGLELKYDDVLRGKDGEMVVSVYSTRQPQFRTDQFGMPQILFDSLGRKLEEEESLRIDPTPGATLRLTVDAGLQAKCEEVLEKQVMIGTNEACRGAIVVLEANTGAVLALASTPGYDPGVFVTGGMAEARRAALEIEKDPESGQFKLIDPKLRRYPMLNRGYQSIYPPGSTFKVLMACAALEEGVLKEHDTYGCGGYFSRAGLNRTWRCWTYNRGGHGGVDVVEALSRSCDVFFYHVGLKLGEEKLKEWATRMGLGVKTGIDLPGEQAGLIPDPVAYKESMKKKFPKEPHKWRWYPWQTVNMSIGQSLAVTPLQNAVMMACVLNGGRRVRPYVNQALGPEVSEPFLSEATLRVVQQGMRQCVEDNEYPRGTGVEARVPGLIVLGKTGTAQVADVKVTDRYGKREDRIPYALRDHALFVCGVMDPERPIAVSIIVEHGLHGSSTCSPMAKEILEYFYKVPQEPEKKTKVARTD